VLQCVASSGSVCVAVCCSVCCNALYYAKVCCGQCVAAPHLLRVRVLQCVAECCSLLQRVTAYCSIHKHVEHWGNMCGL